MEMPALAFNARGIQQGHVNEATRIALEAEARFSMRLVTMRHARRPNSSILATKLAITAIKTITKIAL